MTTLREIQARVGVEADGVLGPKTLDAIMRAIGGPVARRPSPAIRNYVRAVETLHKLRGDGMVEAYLPTPDDVPTIGFGSTGPDIALGTVWTVAKCEARFAQQFDQFAASVDDLLGNEPTSEGEFDALVSLAYNIGVGPKGLAGSTLLRKHRAGDHVGAAAEFPRWNKQAGKVLGGLTKRRAFERTVYEGTIANV